MFPDSGLIPLGYQHNSHGICPGYGTYSYDISHLFSTFYQLVITMACSQSLPPTVLKSRE